MSRNRSLYINPNQRTRHTPKPISQKSKKKRLAKDKAVHSTTPTIAIRRSPIVSAILQISKSTDYLLLFVQEKKSRRFHIVDRDDRKNPKAVLGDGTEVDIFKTRQFGQIQKAKLNSQLLYKLAFSPRQLEILLGHVQRFSQNN